MECERKNHLYEKQLFMERFRSKMFSNRIPITGGIEITNRCNFRCIHCYLGRQTENWKQKFEELTCSQWLRIIDEITEAGCLFLLITGGEPLLRRDFSAIYSHAKNNGLVVTVFTNGSLVTDEILNLFDELPPYTVEVTLYGATEKTYEKITGVKNAFSTCMNGIKKLHDANLNLRLKTILMSVNQDEFFDIEQIAKEFNSKFRFDASLFPGFDGDRSQIELRVTPKDAVEIEFSSKKRFEQLYEFFEKRKNNNTAEEFVYTCGSGRITFFIDCFGFLKPCLMVEDVKYDLKKGGFLEGWQNRMDFLLEEEMPEASKCKGCNKKELCGYCPPFFYLENGSELQHSEFICELGHHRYRMLRRRNSLEDGHGV